MAKLEEGSQKAQLVETEPLLPNSNLAATAASYAIAASFFAFAPVYLTLTVFTGRKIAADPQGFSREEVSLGQSLVYAGWGVSAILVVPYCDSLGRKPVLLGLLYFAIFGLFGTLSTRSVLEFEEASFVFGFIASTGQVAYLVCQESIPSAWRPTSLMCLNVGFSLCIVLVSLGCKYLTHDLTWRTETLLWFTPFLIVGFLGPLLLKETLQRPCPGESSEDSTAASKGGGWPLLMSREYFFTMICTCSCWVTCALGYYGLSFTAGNLSDDIYMNMVYLACVDIVSSVSAGEIVSKTGASRTQLSAFVCAGIAMCCSGSMPAGSIGVLATAMFARFCLNLAFFTVYTLVVEHFPNNCRSTATGVANFTARAAAMAAPVFQLLSAAEVCGIISTLCFVASIATWCLPRERETS